MSTSRISNVIMAGAACLAAATGMPARADQAMVSFDLPAGTVESVLPEFARQAGFEIVAPADVGGGTQVRVAALHGDMTPRDALQRLIAGTGLVVVADNGNEIVLKRPSLYASLAGAGVTAVQNSPQTAQSPNAPVAPAATNAAVTAQATPPADEVSTLEQVTVVGSQIRGSGAATMLPVQSLDTQQIEATGAISGDELYRSIPQMGDVGFTSGVTNNLASSANVARGDVASVNLRGLGEGNTLMLINGRRTVVHPTSQADDQLVPVLGYNANVIPVANLARVEVLLDGAAAIYGTDAVAGVANNVLRDDVDGGSIGVQRGFAPGTGLRNVSVNGVVGKNSEDLRGNVTLAYSYYDTSGLNSLDQDWTSSADRSSDFVGTRFEGDSILDQRSPISQWGNFTLADGTAVMSADGTELADEDGGFHVHPQANGECGAPRGDGVCLAVGPKESSGLDRNTRADSQARWPLTLRPDVRRINLFLTAKHAFDNGIELFNEFGAYRSDASALQAPASSISSLPLTIPASNYWNPFGAARLPDGSPNRNRIDGANIPAEGLPVTINSYRFGQPTRIDVRNRQYRALVGLRGFHGGFDWETALSWSRASVRDVQDHVSMTLLQQALADATPDAYNPFNPDNPDSAMAPFMVRPVRKGTTTLSMWDARASRPDLFSWYAGDVGLAAGMEVRRETQQDNRDVRSDGTLTFTDMITGTTLPSDLYGASPTPDTYGTRTVSGGFVELSLPLISQEMALPLVRSLDLQLAGRAEHYSDFGSVSKPKLALGMELPHGLRLRASWAQGFRAPNLEQVNATIVTRSNTRTDWIQCEADTRSGAIGSFNDCSDYSTSTSARRSGNPDLKPETSENFGAGLVFEPQFLRDAAGRLSFSADYFKYEQEGIVGLFGEGNALILDYLLRTQGSSNPNVVRAEPTSSDVERYAGTGLAPAGRVLYVNDRYTNLQPQVVRGVDYAARWASSDTAAGKFNVSITGTRLIEFYRDRSPEIQALADAQMAGEIDPTVPIGGGGSLIARNGRPEWKWTGNFSWNYRRITLGGSVRYISAFDDIDLTDDQGNSWRVDSSTRTNLFARYDNAAEQGWLAGTSVKLGVNNVSDKRPPVAFNDYGLAASVYQPLPRYWYLNLTKEF